MENSELNSQCSAKKRVPEFMIQFEASGHWFDKFGAMKLRIKGVLRLSILRLKHG